MKSCYLLHLSLLAGLGCAAPDPAVPSVVTPPPEADYTVAVAFDRIVPGSLLSGMDLGSVASLTLKDPWTGTASLDYHRKRAIDRIYRAMPVPANSPWHIAPHSTAIIIGDDGSRHEIEVWLSGFLYKGRIYAMK